MAGVWDLSRKGQRQRYDRDGDNGRAHAKESIDGRQRKYRRWKDEYVWVEMLRLCFFLAGCRVTAKLVDGGSRSGWRNTEWTAGSDDWARWVSNQDRCGVDVQCHHSYLALSRRQINPRLLLGLA